MSKDRQVSDEEKEATKRNIENQEYALKVVQHQKKKLSLQLEELPLMRQMIIDKMKQSDVEEAQITQAISDGKKLLER